MPMEQVAMPQQEKTGRLKRKGQRRVGKKTEGMPLAGMMDEISGAFDKPVSVREVLKRDRVILDWWTLLVGAKTPLHSCVQETTNKNKSPASNQRNTKGFFFSSAKSYIPNISSYIRIFSGSTRTPISSVVGKYKHHSNAIPRIWCHSTYVYTSPVW